MLSGGGPADIAARYRGGFGGDLAPACVCCRPARAACGLSPSAIAVRFLGQSVVAGVDVARRALDPRLPLPPGLCDLSVGLPPGPARNMFTTLMSLLPGTVPTGVRHERMTLIFIVSMSPSR